MSGRDFKPGILFAVRWLHERAASMTDDKAKAILNSAGFHLGQARSRGECEMLPEGYRILGPDEVDPVTVERCAEEAESYVDDDGSNLAGRAIAGSIRSLSGDGR